MAEGNGQDAGNVTPEGAALILLKYALRIQGYELPTSKGAASAPPSKDHLLDLYGQCISAVRGTRNNGMSSTAGKSAADMTDEELEYLARS